MDENIHSAGRFYYLGGYRSNLVETRHITLPRRSGDNVQPETRAPSNANRSAQDRPIPLAEPVITATLFGSRIGERTVNPIPQTFELPKALGSE